MEKWANSIPARTDLTRNSQKAARDRGKAERSAKKTASSWQWEKTKRTKRIEKAAWDSILVFEILLKNIFRILKPIKH
jgi:hypothetical protein